MSAAESTMKFMTSSFTLPLTKYLELPSLFVEQILTIGSFFSFLVKRLLFDSSSVKVSRVSLVSDCADGIDVVAKRGGVARSDADEGSGAEGMSGAEERGDADGMSGAEEGSGAVGWSGAEESSGADGWSGTLVFGGILTTVLSFVFA